MKLERARTISHRLRGAWLEIGSGGRRFVVASGFIIAFANLLLWLGSERDLLEIAYAFPNGGGYCSIKDSGVPVTIKHNGAVVLPESKGGSYCCGFTFTVAMKVAQERGLLAGKSTAEVRRFQRMWYGSENGYGVSQCAGAVTDLNIGREITIEDAEPGDFICFNRSTNIGHSVVLLGWVHNEKNEIIGLHYRSSQPLTGGIGDGYEYFSDTGIGRIDRASVRIARLNHSKWARIMHLFG